MKKHTILWIIALTAIAAFMFSGCPNESSSSESFGPPTKIVATATSQTTIVISWAQVSGALQYYVYMGSGSGSYGNNNRIGITVPTDTGVCSYTASGLSANTTYSFTISSYNNKGESNQSLSVSATTFTNLPAAPTGLYASADSSSSISLSWDTVPSATGYYVYKSSSATGTFYKATTSLIYTTYYTDSSLSANTTYYYKVSAYNSFGEGPQSYSYVSATTDNISVPNPPSSITATAQSSSSIYISWYSVSNATGYYVYRSSSATGTYSKITSSYVYNTYYTDTLLSANTTYYYKVSSYNSSGESSLSTYYDYATTSSSSGGLGSEFNPISLGAGIWTDGSITLSGSAVWYSFNVAYGNSYYIWLNDSDASQGKTLDAKVSASYSSGTSIFTGSDSAYTTAQSFTASSSTTVKIKVESLGGSGTGTFAVAYNTSSTRPTASSGTETYPVSLTAGVWSDGVITSYDSDVWYSFNGTSGTTYYLWWNDSYSGNGTKTTDVYVTAYNSDDTEILSYTDSSWTYYSSISPSSSGTIKIKVDGSSTGTFALVYSTSSTRPSY